MKAANRSSRTSRRTFAVASLTVLVVLVAVGIVLTPLIKRLALDLRDDAWNLFGNAPSIDRLVSKYETPRSQFGGLARMASADPTFALQMTKHGAYLEDTGPRSSPTIPQVLTHAA